MWSQISRGLSPQNSFTNVDRAQTRLDDNPSWIDWLKNGITYEKKGDQKGSIMGYDETFATTIGAFLFIPGSLFTFYEILAIGITSGGICYILAHFSCLYKPNLTNCIALPQPSTTLLTLLTLCSFVMAFFINTVVQRWWTTRTLIQSVYGSCIDVVMLVSNAISMEIRLHAEKNPGDYSKIESMGKTYMKRFAGLATLAFHCMINSGRKTNDITDLLTRGVITDREYAYFAAMPPAIQEVCSMMLCLLHEAARKGFFEKTVGISEANFLTITNAITSIRGNSAMALLYVNVQLPFPFIQMVSCISYLFMIQLLFVSASFIAFGLSENNSSYVMFGLLTIILYNGVLIGMLKLFVILCNPMGEDQADFPLNSYARTLEGVLRGVVDKAIKYYEFTEFELDMNRSNEVDDGNIIAKKFDSFHADSKFVG